MNYPEVTVQEIIANGIEGLTLENPPIEIDLGGQHDLQTALTKTKMESIRQAIRKEAKHVFLLTWEGSKIPRGVDILGNTIAWTQNGIVRDNSGQQIGTYDRLTEFGGVSGNEQKMLVYAFVTKQ